MTSSYLNIKPPAAVCQTSVMRKQTLDYCSCFYNDH